VALTNFDATERLQLTRQATNTSMALAANVQAIAPSELEHARDAVATLRRLRDTAPRFDPTSIDFDLFALRDEAPDGAAARDYGSAVVFYLLQSAGFDRVFKIEEDTLMCFILQCRKMYRFVPYHNFFHAVDAVQTTYTFLFSGGGRQYVSELESFVLLITALVHDLDHMGTNNSYHFKTDSPLGILSAVSGNNSVLEVHHCNVAIQILSGPDCNIFSGLSKADMSVAYRDMLSCVLVTDMARHNDSLKQFEDLTIAVGFNREKDEHRLVAMQMMMKAADISNVTKPFHISRQWAVAVTEEFYQQGDKERARGLAVLPMNDRQLGTELAKGQLGFINFVAMKFFTSLHKNLFKDMTFAMERITSNKAQWDAMLAANAIAPPSAPAPIASLGAAVMTK
jgi:cAMP-specific phosphodiesterase